VTFLRLRLTAPRPPDPAYPEELQTIGDHLRARRLDLGLLQKEVAERLGASQASVLNWEKGRLSPDFTFLPAVIRFLGYDPRPEGETLGEKLYRARTARGIPGSCAAGGGDAHKAPEATRRGAAGGSLGLVLVQRHRKSHPIAAQADDRL
jgi:DNA-binding XRE family transcriptional regulator